MKRGTFHPTMTLAAASLFVLLAACASAVQAQPLEPASRGVHGPLQRQGPHRLEGPAQGAVRQSGQAGRPAGGRVGQAPAGSRRGHAGPLERRRWRAQLRRQGPKPLHGQGLRRLRDARRLEDRERRRQRHLPAGLAPGADLGHGQPRRSAPRSAPAASTTTRRTRASRRRWPTSPSASGTRSASSWSATRSPSTSTASWSSTTSIMENYWDYSKPIFPTGQIELQNHGNFLYFRNIYIREILPAEERLAGFAPLFNGRDMTGWVGNTTGYYAQDGKMICDPKKAGGNVYTANEYGDFVFRFEFKLAPGANNGLGIRAPLEGDAAYEGMEIQILDDTAAQYATLQPYQYHGSIYGVVPAKRGLPQAGRRVELRGGHRQGPPDHRQAQRRDDRRRRHRQGQHARDDGPSGPSGSQERQGPHRLLRPRRLPGVPQHPDQVARRESKTNRAPAGPVQETGRPRPVGDFLTARPSLPAHCIDGDALPFPSPQLPVRPGRLPN